MPMLYKDWLASKEMIQVIDENALGLVSKVRGILPEQGYHLKLSATAWIST